MPTEESIMFKSIIPLREMREELERLKLLESWHWSMSAKHRDSHTQIIKKRRELEINMTIAEHKFASEAIKD